MKYIASIIMAFLTVVGSAYAGEMSQPLRKFLDGCVAMRSAVENNDFPSLTDAKLALSAVGITKWSEQDFYPADSLSLSYIGEPKILYTPEFANELVKKGVISIEEDVKDAHLMRDSGGELQLWHASIMPHSEASFVSLGLDDCQMLLFSLSDANLKLIVESDNGVADSVNPLNDKSVWLATWTMPSEPSEFKFKIINENDRQASFVIAIN